MLVDFTKMHGLGNDFIVIDAITQKIKLNNNFIKQIANRNTGIGCDQILLLEPPIHPLSDYYYKIYNSDGTTAEQCLNGARCTARFALDSGLVNKKTIIADCTAGKVTFNIGDNQLISVNLGIINSTINNFSLKSKTNNVSYTVYYLSIGNPHAIVILPDKISSEHPEIEHEYYRLLAEDIAKHELFPLGINVGFVKITNLNNIRLRVFERGTGETLACGSNAVAAFLVTKYLNLITNHANILFKLGILEIKLENNCIITTGPANSVFIGKFKI